MAIEQGNLNSVEVLMHQTTFDELVLQAKGVKEAFVILSNNKETSKVIAVTFDQKTAENYIRDKTNEKCYYAKAPILEADGYDFKDVEEMEEHQKCPFSKDSNQ